VGHGRYAYIIQNRYTRHIIFQNPSTIASLHSNLMMDVGTRDHNKGKVDFGETSIDLTSLPFEIQGFWRYTQTVKHKRKKGEKKKQKH